MKLLRLGVIAAAIALLNACGADSDEPSPTQAQPPAQTAQGILTNSQQQALDAANSVQQTLLDAAADREEELANRLQQQ
ncbi:MAG: hypothetical protein DHS20C12_26770 [Pseudohongiella sp.]|nr:MAG: hypothetical protein DHS20C12_26770 [Pseudohongiella sp.]